MRDKEEYREKHLSDLIDVIFPVVTLRVERTKCCPHAVLHEIKAGHIILRGFLAAGQGGLEDARCVNVVFGQVGDVRLNRPPHQVVIKHPEAELSCVRTIPP